jgi:hypothetical protein
LIIIWRKKMADTGFLPQARAERVNRKQIAEKMISPIFMRIYKDLNWTSKKTIEKDDGFYKIKVAGTRSRFKISVNSKDGHYWFNFDPAFELTTLCEVLYNDTRLQLTPQS